MSAVGDVSICVWRRFQEFETPWARDHPDPPPIRRASGLTAMDSMIASKGAQRDALLVKVEHLNAADSRLFYRIVQQHIGPLSQWPLHILTHMLCTHLTFQPRMSLTLFLLGNRCPPDLFCEWYMQRNMLRDDSARRHVANLVQEHKAGKLIKFDTYILPTNVTFNYAITPALGKKMFERGEKLVPSAIGGNPAPPHAISQAFVFPVDTPNPGFMHSEGWRWDRAYTMLTGQGKVLSSAFAENLVKIVPLNEAAFWPIDECDCLDYMHTAKKQKVEVPHGFSDATIAHLAVPPRAEDGPPRAIYFSGSEDAPMLVAADPHGVADLY
jgi:hypothetical protein